jgi:hypothetical protein
MQRSLFNIIILRLIMWQERIERTKREYIYNTFGVGRMSASIEAEVEENLQKPRSS